MLLPREVPEPEEVESALARGTETSGASSRLGWSPSSLASCRETTLKLVVRVGLLDFVSDPCSRKLLSPAIFEAIHRVLVAVSGTIHRRI
ncbi:hypothetical protein U1Q18_017109 [Sarracenia purpurea var. burkii]